jgi:hypothetical protein
VSLGQQSDRTLASAEPPLRLGPVRFTLSSALTSVSHRYGVEVGHRRSAPRGRAGAAPGWTRVAHRPRRLPRVPARDYFPDGLRQWVAVEAGRTSPPPRPVSDIRGYDSHRHSRVIHNSSRCTRSAAVGGVTRAAGTSTPAGWAVRYPASEIITKPATQAPCTRGGDAVFMQPASKRVRFPPRLPASFLVRFGNGPSSRFSSP